MSNLLRMRQERRPDDRFTSWSRALITRALGETHWETIGKVFRAFRRLLTSNLWGFVLLLFFFLCELQLCCLDIHSRVIGSKPSCRKSYQALLRFSTVQSGAGSPPPRKDEPSPDVGSGAGRAEGSRAELGEAAAWAWRGRKRTFLLGPEGRLLPLQGVKGTHEAVG